MFPIIGILVVLGCIAGGYLMEKGNFLVLMQPAELIIIGGAAIGTVLIGNPPYILKSIISSLMPVFKGSHYMSEHLPGYPAIFERFFQHVAQERHHRAGKRSRRARKERAIQAASQLRQGQRGHALLLRHHANAAGGRRGGA